MKQFNIISIISLTVLSVICSSVTYANNSAGIHSSSVVAGTLNIYDIELKVYFEKDDPDDPGGGYPDIYTSEKIKIHNINNDPSGEGGGYLDTEVWGEHTSQTSPAVDREEVTLAISTIFAKSVSDPSIQLKGDFRDFSYVVNRNREVCRFRPSVSIRKSSEGDFVPNVMAGSCKLKVVKFKAFIE